MDTENEIKSLEHQEGNDMSFERRDLETTLVEVRISGSQDFPLPTDNWSEKAKRRKTTGTGRMQYLKNVTRRFHNGFRVGAPKNARGPQTSAAAAAAAATPAA